LRSILSNPRPGERSGAKREPARSGAPFEHISPRPGGSVANPFSS